MNENRRRFHRVQFNLPAKLFLDSGELSSEVIDLSLRGALIRRKPEWSPVVGSEVTLECDLIGNGEEVIRMDAVVRHLGEETIGLGYQNIDLDSIMRLRRLVELNLGSPALLERELENLILDQSDETSRK
ncbi:MAG: PilZ domain-containing protein [Gammaproteobacteria bacterium]|nr:PilZ domain-containing protein [Gammaproteobacteria bacterium]MBU1654519.1 PilZ domain-containing protein [Gammaproteobacteria bacterium]MBU1962676.1 PilZ domain-containing protein [Gammaproteobacteria bacterium]